MDDTIGCPMWTVNGAVSTGVAVVRSTRLLSERNRLSWCCVDDVGWELCPPAAAPARLRRPGPQGRRGEHGPGPTCHQQAVLRPVRFALDP